MWVMICAGLYTVLRRWWIMLCLVFSFLLFGLLRCSQVDEGWQEGDEHCVERKAKGCFLQRICEGVLSVGSSFDGNGRVTRVDFLSFKQISIDKPSPKNAGDTIEKTQVS